MRTERQFTMQDQQHFASLTGDRNPMHVDAVAARRVGAGVPVVHGVHTLLWSLDIIASSLAELLPISSLRANFDTFIKVGETAEVIVLKLDDKGVRAVVRVADVTALTIALGFGDPRAPAATVVADGQSFDGDEALELTLDQMDGRSGRVKLATSEADMQKAFPNAARLLGAQRVAGLGAMTRLVGMVCPGLHSIFNGISLTTGPVSADDEAGIAYRVGQIDPRYRRLVQSVSGCGWSGTLTCSARHPPTPQPSMQSLAGTVAPDAFRGSTALIVGGSRGLGELTAKLISTGGGAVIVTYATGRADADRLVQSIHAVGGSASTLCYDVMKEPDPQLALLQAVPTHLYYFATPVIAGRKSAIFSPERLAQFTEFYVTGFAGLVEALRKRTPDGLRVLYPSTVFIEDRPSGMTEYAMAKAAGEVLCADLGKDGTGVKVLAPRLPRLPTDQTAALVSVETGDPVSALLPYIVMLQA